MSERQQGRIDSILVPLSGVRTDDAVMRWACVLAKKMNAHINALHVITVKQALPLDADQPKELARGEEILLRAKGVGEKYGITVTLSEVQARLAGVAIVEEAANTHASIILMAVTYRNRLGEFDMGKTVPYVLKNATCAVMLYREPITPELVG